METTSPISLHMVPDGKGPTERVAPQDRESGRPILPMRSSIQSGEHIVWPCPLYLRERRRNRIDHTAKGEWADLDNPIWVPNDDVEGRIESDDQQVDGVEIYFDYLMGEF